MLLLALIVISMTAFSQALIKEFEWKKGFTGNYWIPIRVTYDNTQGTTNVCMGLYKNAALWNEVKDTPEQRQSNVLAQKEEFRLVGKVLEANLLDSIKAYKGPYYGPGPMGRENTYVNFFSDAVIQN